MKELYQATVGIAGMGDIGIEIAKRCRAFGMTIVYHQRTPIMPAVETTPDARRLPLDELLMASLIPDESLMSLTVTGCGDIVLFSKNHPDQV